MEQVLYFLIGLCVLIVVGLLLKITDLDKVIEEKINEGLEALSDKFYWTITRPVRIAVSNFLYRVGDAIHNVAYKCDVDW